MSQHLYICGAEQGSGKSIVVLAAMEHFSGRSGRVAFFRPVVHDPDGDPLLHLIRRRYHLKAPPTALCGCTTGEARQLIAADRYDDLLQKILEKYLALEADHDLVLCAGSDYTGPVAALEFDFNADVANNLGCRILPVVRGFGRDPAAIRDAAGAFLKSLQERHCDLLATVINGVPCEHLGALRAHYAAEDLPAPLHLIPEDPVLARPTMADVARGLDTCPLHAEEETLNRDIGRYLVAAMQVPDFLDYLEEQALVITPGDRADIILACLAAHQSSACPRVAGMLLSGGQRPAPQVERLLAGLGTLPFAILGAGGDTFSTAMAVSSVKPSLAPENEARIAAALGLVERHLPFAELEEGLAASRPQRVTPLMFQYELLQRARRARRHIVLPEGTEPRILRAAAILNLRDVARLTLLGTEDEVLDRIQALGLELADVDIIDPQRSPLRERYAETYHALRRHKGVSLDMAHDAMTDVNYFGTMMVHHGDADGMVSGAVHTTQQTIRPAFEIIKTRPGVSIVSSVFFMCLEDRVLVYGDCAVNPDPDAAQLADIAISSAETARQFGIEPRIAMLSYATGDSGKGAAVDKVAEATRLVKSSRPDLAVEGPIQYDAAVDASVAHTKLPGSSVAGRATVFIFPDLNTGNNTYKAVQRSAGAVAIGPVLQGLKRPVNDLSRGSTVTDIVNTVAITAVQAGESAS